MPFLRRSDILPIAQTPPFKQFFTDVRFFVGIMKGLVDA
jgi:hypothetical protein